MNRNRQIEHFIFIRTLVHTIAFNSERLHLYMQGKKPETV